jgi:hypothetical protein
MMRVFLVLFVVIIAANIAIGNGLYLLEFVRFIFGAIGLLF